MSKGREIADYIEDIITAIADIEDFTHGMSYQIFSSDKKTVNAVIRCLEVLGEAAKHIPTSLRKKHPDIPWSKMAGMWNVLIHDYMGVNLMTVWKVSQERLLELKPLLEGLINGRSCPENQELW